jgi:hypothetical protein
METVRWLAIAGLADAEAVPVVGAVTEWVQRETTKPLDRADTVSAPGVGSGSSVRPDGPVPTGDAKCGVQMARP